MNCQSLNDDGKKCRRKANKLPYNYFGDPEISKGNDWVRVYFCSKCYTKK